MKTLILALSLLASSSAFATDGAELDAKVLTALVRVAGQVTLVDNDGKPLSPNWQLPNVMASAMLGGYLSARDGKDSIVLRDGSVSCEKTGAEAFECGVNFINGDFSVKGDGSLSGPEMESSISILVPVTEGKDGKVRIMSKTLKTMLAG